MSAIKTRKREIYEVLSDANKAENPSEVLKEHATLGLKVILQVVFKEDVNFAKSLPDSRPEEEDTIKFSVAGQNPADLDRDIKKLTIFLEKHGYDHVSSIKREKLFIQLLEGVHPGDADLLLQILCGEFEEKHPNITKEVVESVFPEILV